MLNGLAALLTACTEKRDDKHYNELVSRAHPDYDLSLSNDSHQL
jgi:hypothetical protein